MGTTYGKISHLIRPVDIDNIIIDTSDRTTYSISTDPRGGAVITCSMLRNTANGCSSNNGISLQLVDVFNWTRVYCKFFSTGTASCFGWNGNNGYGLDMTSSQRQGNLLAYNESNNDFTRNEFNVWELSAYRKYFSGCDNNADNYMRFNTTGRSFDIYSRRNNMNILAGPSHGRTCSSDGTVVISRIFIT